MNLLYHALCLAICNMGFMAAVYSQEAASPLDNLPGHITQLTHFGERADWSHDGKRILFLARTFGDVYEIELETRVIRPVTHHFYHEGFVRALYLSNGDILLSGAKTFDADDPMPSRHDLAELWVLDKSLSKPPVPLGQKCSEGPAVSRRRLKIAYTIDHGDYPALLKEGQTQVWTADLEYQNGNPILTNKTLVLDNTTLSFKTGLECQNFRPPQEDELIFSAYGYQGTEVMGVHLMTGEITNYSNAPDQYDEPEGIFPDGQYTLVECDKHNHKGVQHIDIYKLKLDGSGEYQRLTFFNDTPGYKSSNPVVSDDGRYMAFQMAKFGDIAGFGRGILIYDFSKANP